MADYGNLMGAQCPGSLGDSSEYNIDGACFVADETESIICGKIVTVRGMYEGQYKEISDRFTAQSFAYGVAMRSHMETFVDDEGYMAYRSGDPINVISHGRAWVLTENIDEQPTFGQPVRVGTDGFAHAGGFEIPGWIYTGGWRKWNSLFYIVEIQIIQSAPFVYHSRDKLVNGCALLTDLPSPQDNIKLVKVTADVSPKDATNILGRFSLEGPDIATIIDNGDNTAQIIPKGGDLVGSVYVYWTANDLSGVQSMIKYEFTNNALGL